MITSVQFLGAAGTVTGSKYLLESGDGRVLVDCGLFQGYKQLRLRNWALFPVDPATIDTVVLTHAHLDHSGYIPVLIRNGFGGRVLCTEPTRDLCSILLPDSGFLLEKDAEFANRHGFSKHRPALPLYTRREAEDSLARFVPAPFGKSFDVAKGVSGFFRHAGHILGAATLEISAAGRRIVFSGDLGRYNSATMPDPEPVPEADVLVVESTYGDRRHPQDDSEDALAGIITKTAARGGTVLIPAFAVGRTQTVLYHLARLKAAHRIPDIPVFLDSPMAVNASRIFCGHLGDHKLTAEMCQEACSVAEHVNSVEASKALNVNPMSKVIVSASGMATGGRVLHHLKVYAPDHRNTILFTGFQAGGTRGAAMVHGADSVKIHGSYIPVRAEVSNLDALSAHADAEEILTWLRGFRKPPRMTFITHGEPQASDALRIRIEEELGWACRVPEHLETVALT
jgi:metallo-beta-lactamase family protein